METAILEDCMYFREALGNFLSGMETDDRQRVRFHEDVPLETSLVEWKPSHLQAPRWRHSPLETSLVEWKQELAALERPDGHALETSLVEWKRVFHTQPKSP